MKQMRKLMVAFMAMATLAMVGCDKDDNKPNNDNPGGGGGDVNIELAGTSWVGIYDDSYQGVAVELAWSLDFTSATEGGLYREVTVGGQQQSPEDMPFTYTYSNGRGVVTLTTLNNAQFSFTYDPATNTIKADIGISTSEGISLGGVTTFYPRGTDPVPHSGNGGNGGGGTGGGVTPGEITDAFPANTSWTSSEETYYQLTPINIEYELNFANDHTGSVSLTVLVQGNAQAPQTFAFNWTYDEASSSGTVILQGNSLPFTYDTEADQIHISFPFATSQTDTFGSNLVFDRTN